MLERMRVINFIGIARYKSVQPRARGALATGECISGHSLGALLAAMVWQPRMCLVGIPVPGCRHDERHQHRSADSVVDAQRSGPPVPRPVADGLTGRPGLGRFEQGLDC